MTQNLNDLFSNLPYQELISKNWSELSKSDSSFRWNVNWEDEEAATGLGCKIEQIGNYFDISVFWNDGTHTQPLYRRSIVLVQDD